MANRKRRSNRSAHQERLDQSVVMFAFQQDDEICVESWLYRSVTLAIAREMVAAGEAEKLQFLTDNGLVTMFRETLPHRAHSGYKLATMLSAATTEAVGNNQPGAVLTPAERTEIAMRTIWPFEGDSKACRVGPRISQRDHDEARKLLHREMGTRPATAGHCYRSRNGDIRTLHIDGSAAA